MEQENSVRKELLTLSLKPYEEKYPDILEDLDPIEFQAVRKYFSGNYRTLKEIAEELPISASTVSKVLAKPEVKEYWTVLRQMFYQDMASATMKGSEVVHSILDDQDASSRDKLAAVRFAAEVAGVDKADQEAQSKKGSYRLSEAVKAVMGEVINMAQKEQLINSPLGKVNGEIKKEIEYHVPDNF